MENTKVSRLIKELLIEVEVSNNEILKAIENSSVLQIQKNAVHGDKSETVIMDVVPINITGDGVIVGLTKDEKEITFNLDQIIKKPENLSEGLTISAKALDNLDAKKVMDLASKTDIEIKEESGEVETKTQTDQELTCFNLKNWAYQLGISLGKATPYKDIFLYNLLINHKPLTAFIYSDGLLKVGGHTVKSFDDFKNIISFFQDIV